MKLTDALKIARDGVSQAEADDAGGTVTDGPLERTHFPALDADVKRRLSERGIDPERSIRGLFAEVCVDPPARLLNDLASMNLTEDVA